MSTQSLRPAKASTPVLFGAMNRRLLVRSALAGLYLPGGLLLTFIIASVLGQFIEGTAGQIVLVALTLICCAVGGALWSRTLAIHAQVPHSPRLLVFTGIVNAVGTILLMLVLGALEEDLVGNGNTTLPVHNLYTLLFVSAAFISGAGLGAIVGFCVDGVNLALRLAWRGALASAAAYLILNILQDLLGRRVGGPNAAETATMITVTLVCNIGSAMALSVVLVYGLKTAEVK